LVDSSRGGKGIRRNIEGTPLTKIENKDKEVILRTQLTEASLKPKVRRSECMYFQLILSKALEISSLINKPGVQEYFREWITL